MHVVIDDEQCIGCGACVEDCVGSNLRVEDGVAQVVGGCILCGHCVAVCPTEAASIPAYDMADVEPSAPASGAIEPSVLLRAIKSRRSIRDYLPRAVEPENLDLLLQAGRYTATAKNSQGCRFIVVQDELAHLKDLLWGGIEQLLALSPAEKPRWVKLYKSFFKGTRAELPVDFLFRNAPAVVFVATDRADDAGLAAQNIELMAATLGLGVLYNGYLCRAAEELPAVKTWLGAEDKPLQVCMLLGYPTTTYPRTAPRLPGDFVVK